MKHLAIIARCLNSQKAYTATGLGDRIHSCTLGWAYGQGEPVTLHLTSDKWVGGQFNNKPESWSEVVALFPPGSLTTVLHPVKPKTEREWVDYLGHVEHYCYGDYIGKYEMPGFDISPYLKRIPLLSAEPQRLELPDRFFTLQWDANAASRGLPLKHREAIVGRYKAQGLVPVVVGGESQCDRLRWSLKHIAYAMSRAQFHVGVDSAFLHLAQLYMPIDRIHLYSLGAGGHHVLRARDNGARMNLYL